MARMQFTRLVCEQTQDSFGPDEAYMAVFVDGEYAGNIFRELITGQALNFGFTLDFETEIRVQLWEVDDPAAGNPHDFLGEIRVGPQDTATNGLFDNAGGRYTLEFQVEPAPGPVEEPDPLVLRKDQANMTDDERQRFRNAITTLIDNETFGQFVQDHAGPSGNFEFRNHVFAGTFGAMRFLPWHRAYLVNLERRLRQIDPVLFIPYWRWTVNRAIPDWLSDFMPPVRMPDGSLLQVQRNVQPFQLPTTAQVNLELANPTFATFSPAIEGGSHGQVHMWVRGNMGDAVIASSDVLFWLHHCEIDRLWDVWQRTHSDGPSLPVSERIMDPYAESVEQVMNVADLDYTYA